MSRASQKPKLQKISASKKRVTPKKKRMQTQMRFHIISLFPDTVLAYASESIVKRAIEDARIKVYVYNPKAFANTPRERIDKKPYGGGPGMVIQAEPVLRAYEAAQKQIQKVSKKKRPSVLTIFFTPHGAQFDTGAAAAFSKKYTDIICICGRYEGIDARVRKIVKAKDYSVGPYVLTGGEIPAMIIIDAVSRQIEGVLGDFSSREESRVASDEVYTRPDTIRWKKKKYIVPPVLLSGNHKEIDAWREEH